jgi:hypothetical protein
MLVQPTSLNSWVSNTHTPLPPPFKSYKFFSSDFFLSLVQEVNYEKILPTHNAADIRGSTEFNFVIPPRADYFTRFKFTFLLLLFLKNVFLMFFSIVCSFNSDYQMVIDAQAVVTFSEVVAVGAAAAVPQQELLYPPRHQITLPLNNLNFIFDNIEVAFNQTSKFTADK